MELADMRDLGSRAERRAGSTPVTRTTKETSFVYQGKRGFSCFLGQKQAKILKKWG